MTIRKSFACLLLVILTMSAVIGGCSNSEPENLKMPADRTRRDDQDHFRKMLKDFEKWTNQHKPDKFKPYLAEKFDAAHFVDTLWAGVDADRIEFAVRRMRTWPDEARLLAEAKLMRGDQLVRTTIFGIDLVFVEVQQRWLAVQFQIAGEEEEVSLPDGNPLDNNDH